MKNKTEITHIRLLLDRYYQAETTRDQENLLVNFFITTDECDIPEDLLPDRKLFIALQETRPLASDSTAPDSLIHKLNEIVNTPIVVPAVRHYAKWRIALRYSGIAAVAVVIIAIISFIPRLGTYSISEEYTAEAGPSSSTPDKVFTSLIAELNDWNAISEQDIENNCYFEITDPAEAQKIAIEIGQLLSRNAQNTTDALSSIGNTINSCKEITKSILQ